jgi:hypothetical protein
MIAAVSTVMKMTGAENVRCSLSRSYTRHNICVAALRERICLSTQQEICCGAYIA